MELADLCYILSLVKLRHASKSFTRSALLDEAVWPSGLGRWIWNMEVLHPPYRYLFSVTPSSIPRPRWVNNQLVSLPPVGIVNSLCSIWNICLFIYSVPKKPRSIYQYSNIAPKLSAQNCKVFQFLLSLNSQKRLGYEENSTKYGSLTWKPRSHVRILIYRRWPISTLVLNTFDTWIKFTYLFGFHLALTVP